MDSIGNEIISGTYIDLFSGCGGFSLGLGKAGWQGIFAVEKDPMAFNTFRHNLIDSKHGHFNWPEWLPKKETTIQDLLEHYNEQLALLSGKIDLIAGGPPCQGFSMAGRRNPKDPRNQLSNEYIKMVELIRPKYLVLENVRGFNSKFINAQGEKAKKPYSMIVKARLEKLGYKVHTDYVHTKRFGVPQQRVRFIMIGIRNDLPQIEPFNMLESIRPMFLKCNGLPLSEVSAKHAISDLEIANATLVHHSGSLVSGFKKLDYIQPKSLTAYQKLMRKGMGKRQPNSLRLARHKATTVDSFTRAQLLCRPGIALSKAEQTQLGTKKQARTVLDPNAPSKTLTTLPDDLLHYSEPRILTVRESARIQSFPDSFEFKGKYTTGGERRTQECPRYTQVGNAVPPLLAEALGLLISMIQKDI
jgi:DNA (cytosine-5)-methyltransferase 1